MQNKNNQGFTLLEVIVALFIIAIVMTALLQTTALITRNKTHLHIKKMANWVAQDQYYEYVLNANTPKRQGKQSVFGKDFDWSIVIENTEGQGFDKIIVTATYADTSSTLIGYKINEP